MAHSLNSLSPAFLLIALACLLACSPPSSLSSQLMAPSSSTAVPSANGKKKRKVTRESTFKKAKAAKVKERAPRTPTQSKAKGKAKAKAIPIDLRFRVSRRALRVATLLAHLLVLMLSDSRSIDHSTSASPTFISMSRASLSARSPALAHLLRPRLPSHRYKTGPWTTLSPKA